MGAVADRRQRLGWIGRQRESRRDRHREADDRSPRRLEGGRRRDPVRGVLGARRDASRGARRGARPCPREGPRPRRHHRRDLPARPPRRRRRGAARRGYGGPRHRLPARLPYRTLFRGRHRPDVLRPRRASRHGPVAERAGRPPGPRGQRRRQGPARARLPEQRRADAAHRRLRHHRHALTATGGVRGPERLLQRPRHLQRDRRQPLRAPRGPSTGLSLPPLWRGGAGRIPGHAL